MRKTTWGYWIAAILVTILAWKLLASGDLFLAAVGAALVLCSSVFAALIAVGFVMWKFSVEIQKVSAGVTKPVVDANNTVVNAPEVERLH